MRGASPVAVALALVLACAEEERTLQDGQAVAHDAGDPEPEPDDAADPRAVALCDEHCGRLFGACGPAELLYSSEAECRSGCLGSVKWAPGCRSTHEEKLECLAMLPCDEFAVHFSDPYVSACADLVWEEHECG